MFPHKTPERSIMDTTIYTTLHLTMKAGRLVLDDTGIPLFHRCDPDGWRTLLLGGLNISNRLDGPDSPNGLWTNQTNLQIDRGVADALIARGFIRQNEEFTQCSTGQYIRNDPKLTYWDILDKIESLGKVTIAPGKHNAVVTIDDTHSWLVPGVTDPHEILHAFMYTLSTLRPVSDNPDIARAYTVLGDKILPLFRVNRYPHRNNCTVVLSSNMKLLTVFAERGDYIGWSVFPHPTLGYDINAIMEDITRYAQPEYYIPGYEY